MSAASPSDSCHRKPRAWFKTAASRRLPADPPRSGIRNLRALACISALANCLAHSQPSAAEQPTPAVPLIYRELPTQEQQRQRQRALLIGDLRKHIKAIRDSNRSDEEKHAQLLSLVEAHPELFRDLGEDLQQPIALDRALVHMETLFFDVAADLAPDADTREQVLENAPPETQPGPQQPPVTPPLLTQQQRAGEQHPVPKPTPQPAPPQPTPQRSEPAVADKSAESPKPPAASPGVELKVLADQVSTTALHDDTTVLRNVEDDEGEQPWYNTRFIWFGGATQFDHSRYGDLHNTRRGGASADKTHTRRAELTARARLHTFGEAKLQYDLDASIYRDVYLRRVSDSAATRVTLGNQKEPMGLDFMTSAKFLTAMERSSPSTAFKRARGRGLRVDRHFSLSEEDRLLDIWHGDTTYVTASFGVFGEDTENTNDTDLAVTGRLTGGSSGADQDRGRRGWHLGLAASYRDGDFDAIDPKPELNQANRLLLASFDANRQLLVTGEFMYTLGSLHGQAELYLSDYHGSDLDARGWGGYCQVGWLFGGFQQRYRPNEGLWEPIAPGDRHIFEVFARLSHTHGDAEDSPSNNLTGLTLGGNWYNRNLRASVNLVLAATDRDVEGEDAGNALALRLQYLF